MVSTPQQTTADGPADEGTAAGPAAEATDLKLSQDGEKHYGPGSDRAPIETGGAKTFADYDEFAAARDVEAAVDDEVDVFNALIDNIRFDFELDATEKAVAIEALAAELPDRIDEARVSGTIPDHLHEGGSTGGAVETVIGSAKDADGDEDGEKAKTKKVDGADLRRSDFADRGNSDSPGTWKLPLTSSAGGAPNAGRIRDAITALQPSGFRGRRVSLTNPRATVIGRISRAIGRLSSKADRDRLRPRVASLRGSREVIEGELVEAAVTNDPGSIAVFKDHDDQWRWIAVHSNRYRDREKEVFSAEAHKAWTDSVYETGAFPPLRLWHIPVDFGHTDMVDYDEKGFVVSSGVFAEGADDIAEALSRRKDIGCSHGFRFDTRDLDDDGVYHAYRTFEISVLPTRSAANQLTAFSAGREIPTMDDERKAFLLEVAGPERVERLEAALDEMNAYAVEKGLTFKDIADAAFPDLQKVKDVGDGGEAADAEPPEGTETPAAPNAAPATAPEAQPGNVPDADADAGTAEDHPPASPAETPSAEDAAEAAKTFDAAMGGSAPDALVALARGLAPAMREAAAEAVEQATAPVLALLETQATEIEGLKALAPIIEELTKDQDARIAGVIRPRTTPLGQGFSAAQNGDEPDGDDAAKVAEQKARGAEGDGKSEKDMTGAEKAANPYVRDAVGLMATVPGVDRVEPPNTDAAG